jgi:hypothetical protein
MVTRDNLSVPLWDIIQPTPAKKKRVISWGNLILIRFQE